jgi:hypothetical protein
MSPTHNPPTFHIDLIFSLSIFFRLQLHGAVLPSYNYLRNRDY